MQAMIIMSSLAAKRGGINMNFETKVINIVTPLLINGNAEFVYGTLFVEDASDTVGHSIYQALSKEFGQNAVSVNQYTPANGFSYDFVA